MMFLEVFWRNWNMALWIFSIVIILRFGNERRGEHLDLVFHVMRDAKNITKLRKYVRLSLLFFGFSKQVHV